MTAEPLTLRQWIRDHDESWIFVAIYLGLAVGLSVFVSLFWLVVVAALHLALELIRQSYHRHGPQSVFLHALWEVKLDVGLVLLALMLVLYIDVVLGLLGLQSAARAAAVTRAGARIGTRAAAWERNIRTFLLTMDEMARVAHAGLMLRRKRKEQAAASTGAEHEAAATPEGEAEAAAEAAAPADAGDEPAADADGGKADEPPEAEEADQSAEHETPLLPPAETPLVPAWRQRWGMGDHIGVALVILGLLLIAAAPFATHHSPGTAAVALLEELRPFPD